MERFDLNLFERIEIDITLFKLFKTNPDRVWPESLDRFEVVYVMFDDIECNGLSTLSDISARLRFDSAVQFFAPDKSEPIGKLIDRGDNALQPIVDALDEVQDAAVSWLKKNPNVLEPVLDELAHIRNDATIPLLLELAENRRRAKGDA